VVDSSSCSTLTISTGLPNNGLVVVVVDVRLPLPLHMPSKNSQILANTPPLHTAVFLS